MKLHRVMWMLGTLLETFQAGPNGPWSELATQVLRTKPRAQVLKP